MGFIFQSDIVGFRNLCCERLKINLLAFIDIGNGICLDRIDDAVNDLPSTIFFAFASIIVLTTC